MLSYTDLNEIEKHHYTTAAQLTAAHYFYPLLLQDLGNVDDLRERYLRTVSRAELGYKTRISHSPRHTSNYRVGLPSRSCYYPRPCDIRAVT